jgi:hypothetical protein
MVKCQFWINKEGKLFRCTCEATAIARGHDLCPTHYHAILRDNLIRHKKDLEINHSLEMFKLETRSKGLCTEEIDSPIKLNIELQEVDDEEIRIDAEDEEL